MNILEASALYVGSSTVKKVNKGTQMVLAPGGDQLWYKANELPSLDLRFAESKSLNDSVTGSNLITFTRASIGTFVGADGLIKNAAANLLPYSEQLDEWIIGNGSSVIANQAAAPNGTNTADRVQHGSGGSSWIRQDILTAGKTFTASVYAKAVTPGTNDQFTFDIGGLSSVFTATNEWQRFTFTGTASNAAFYLNNGDDSFATDVYFWGAQVEEGSVATDYLPTTNTISGAPRFDHDLVTGESLGLLIEEARTNFALNSDSVPGSSIGTAIPNSTASVVSPRGITETVRQLGRDIPAGGAQTWRVGSTSGGTPNTTYTISFFAKTVAGGTTTINVDINDSTPVGGQATTITGEWTRIVKTGGSRPNTLRFFDMNMVTATQDFYVWGAQIEEGSFATSYIPTASSSVTRAADVAEITGTNFSSFYNQSEGTVFAEVVSYPHPITGKDLLPFAYSDNTANNKVAIVGSTNSSQLNFDVVAGSLQRANLGNFTSPSLKAAGAYKATGSAGSLDGASVVTSSTPNIPSTINRLDIGNSHDGTQALNGHIKRTVYFPVRLPDARLQSITS